MFLNVLFSKGGKKEKERGRKNEYLISEEQISKYLSLEFLMRD